jgi:chloramphenicol-sensitive protein RarD
LLQYITPILQFIIGVFIFGEAMPGSRWLGFVFVWIALMVFSSDAYRHSRRRSRSKRAQLINELEIAEPA